MTDAAGSAEPSKWVQMLLPAAITVASLILTGAMYVSDKAVVEAQQERDLVQARVAAIADMSRQLDRMAALCKAEPLGKLGARPELDRREEGCYTAYLEARSLVFLSRVHIAPDVAAPFGNCESEHLDEWTELRCALREAGSMKYSEARVLKAWSAVLSGRAARSP